MTTGTAAAIPYERPARLSLAFPVLCLWLLILSSFTPVEREQVTGLAQLDVLGMFKLAVRIVTLCGLLLSFGMSARVRPWREVQWFFGPLAIYVAWAVLSTLWSPLRSLSLGQSFSLLSLWLFGAIIALRYQDAGHASQLLKAASGAMLVFSLVMLVAYLTSGESERGYAFVYAHPTTAGATASLGLLVLVMARYFGRWSWASWLLVPGTLIHLWVLVAAENRTALGLTAVCVPLALLVSTARRAWPYLAVGCSLLLGLYLCLDADLDAASRIVGRNVNRLLVRGQSSDEIAGLSGRQELWEVMWEAHAHAPWFGHGYFVTSPTGELEIWGREANFTAHNMFLQALFATGYVGCGLLAWGYWQPLVNVLRAMQLRFGAVIFGGMWLILMVWFTGWGLLDPSILGPVKPLCVVFFMALGIAAADAATAWESQRSGLPAGSSDARREVIQ